MATFELIQPSTLCREEDKRMAACLLNGTALIVGTVGLGCLEVIFLADHLKEMICYCLVNSMNVNCRFA
jgi:hypothetical protein